MINLRYHVVSLTAVFLAIGIGLAFGSSFLDQATVDGLESQLEGLRAGLSERDERISALDDEVSALTDRQDALDSEGTTLLAGQAEAVPVLVIANVGTDEDTVASLVSALEVAGAEPAGTWHLTDRFVLDDDSEIDDLAEVTGSASQDRVTLRREAIAAMAAVIERQQAVPADTEPVDDDPTGPDDPDGEGTPDTGADPPDAEVDPDTEVDPDGEADAPVDDATDEQAVIDELFERGFVEYTPVGGGPERPFVPEGVRVVLVGGAESVPDSWSLLPLTQALLDGPDGAALVLATSALSDEGGMSSLVSTIRDDDQLRDRIVTVDDASQFPGRAAVVLAVADLGSGTVGHYGVADGSTRLLPAPPSS